ncbi:MAG: response regulator [Chlorobi bacterium]|nr:response regulator [Chlorobiota bacterium]
MNKTIFIADDSPTILSYFLNLLGSDSVDLNFFNSSENEDENFDIHIFEDGDLLLKAFIEWYKKGNKIPLCILDMRMVRMDGFTTAKEIRKIDENVQIIIVTAFSDISIEEIKKEFKKDIYFIKKPFNEEEITVLVPSLIKNWNSKQKTSNLKSDYSGMVAKLNKTLKIKETELKTKNELIKKLQKENTTLKEELKELYEKAEDPKKLKTSFLLNMSHEIRTPMNAIVGFSDLLGDPDLTDDQKEEFIELINNSGNDLLNLVDDIIDISRIDSNSFIINKEQVDLIEILDELKREFDYLIKSKKLKELEIIAVNDLDIRNSKVISNHFRVKQVFTKLINNSLKYTKTGLIEFGIKRKDEDNILCYVKDNGIGLSEDKQAKIFDLFSEYDNSYTKKYGGARTGLHLAKSLVQLLGGNIWIDSTLGEGSIIKFTLPHEKAVLTPQKKKLIDQKDQKIDWSNRTFIIAEDVEFNYLYLSEILQKTNAQILWAKNGQEALYLFEKNKKIDCVLMDIQMPVMNGFEATTEIKRKYPDVPVIIQTAYTIDEEREKSVLAGSDDFLSKPIKPSSLYHSISKLLKD